MDLRRFLSENYILAAAPVLGWFAALGYERGYADYYAYSMDFVSVDVKSIMLSLMAIVMYASLALYFAHLIKGATESQNTLIQSLGRIGMFSLVPLLLSFCVAFERAQMYLLAFSFMVALCFIYVTPLFLKGGSYLDRLREVISSTESPLTIGNGFQDSSATSRGLIYVTFGLMFYGFCYGAGTFHAKNKRDFYVYELNEDEYAVLAAYGETLISAKMDGEKISEDIFVRKAVLEGGVFYKKVRLEAGGGKQ